jgi:DNA primase
MSPFFRSPDGLMFSDDKIAEVRDSVDLVALISEHVPLRRQGARFVGLCPFHQEKSPSFGVSRGKNFYYCFGCQASGDAISFLRHVEGLGFMEAIQKLAERSGIELPRGDDVNQAQIDRARSRRERLSEVMEASRAFFEASLAEAEHSAIARAEIEKRGVSPEIAARFRLGYAPLAWDALSRHLAQKRLDLHDAVEVGLVAPRRQGEGYYDRFRHRLMFPVADQHGRLLAFSGRALALPEGHAPEQTPPAKYINSPEGPLYKKGQVLFGLDNARVAIRKVNAVLLCEGNFDLIGLHQAGLDHALAPLGTAFTLEQARLIRRFAEEVVVVFDGDGAGRKATRAAFELLETAGLRSRAVRLPDGYDPDTFLREKGADMLRAMVQSARPVVDFIVEDFVNAVSDAASRGRAIRALGRYWALFQGAIEQDAFVQLVARKFDIRDHTSVRRELQRGALDAKQGEANKLSARGAEARGPLGVLSDAQSSPEASQRTLQVRMRKPDELPERQRLVLSALLEWPELLERPEAKRLATLLTDPDLQAIFLVTARMLEQRGEIDAPALLEEVASNPARAWLGVRLSSVREYDRERAERLLIEGIPFLERDRNMQERTRLKREIQAAYDRGDHAEAAELTRLRNELARS